MTYAHFENVDQLKFEVLAAFQKWADQGRPGSRKTFASTEEHFAEYAPCSRSAQASRFRADIGRAERLPRQVEIIAGRQFDRSGLARRPRRDWEDQTASRLRGRTRRHSGCIRSPRTSWHLDSDKELPTCCQVVIVDDAHRDTDLARLVQCVRSLLASGRHVKLIIGCRPLGSQMVNGELARSDPSEIMRLKPLESLPRADVRRIAEEELGNFNRPQLVEWLVAISRDTTLVTIAGARLLKTEQISHCGSY
jgi:hypothetical protein